MDNIVQVKGKKYKKESLLFRNTVWKVLNEKQQTHYVLKQIDLNKAQKVKNENQNQVGREERFLQILQKSTKTGHENVVECKDWEIKQKTLYLIMEYCEGQSLHQICYTQGLSEASIFKITKQIISGIKYLQNDLGVIHRDLHLSNIIVSKQLKVKVLDFDMSVYINSQSYSLKLARKIDPLEFFLYEEKKSSETYDVWCIGLCIARMLLDGLYPYEQTFDYLRADQLIMDVQKYGNMVIQFCKDYENSECCRRLGFFNSFWNQLLRQIFCEKRMTLKDLQEYFEQQSQFMAKLSQIQKKKQKVKEYQRFKKHKLAKRKELIFSQENKLRKKNLESKLKEHEITTLNLVVALINIDKNTKTLENYYEFLKFFSNNEEQFKITGQSFRKADFTQLQNQNFISKNKSIRKALEGQQNQIKRKIQGFFTTNLYSLYKKLPQRVNLQNFQKHKDFQEYFLHLVLNQQNSFMKILITLMKQLYLEEQKLLQLNIDELEYYYNTICGVFFERLFPNSQFQEELMKKAQVTRGWQFINKRQKEIKEPFIEKNKNKAIQKIVQIRRAFEVGN